MMVLDYELVDVYGWDLECGLDVMDFCILNVLYGDGIGFVILFLNLFIMGEDV